MPHFLQSEQFKLSIHDGTPTITLHDVAVSSVEGWSFLNRTTLLVVDGPGEDGFLLRRIAGSGEDLAPDRWDDVVASAGAVRVLASGADIVAPVIE